MFSVDSSNTGDSVESDLNCIPPPQVLRATCLWMDQLRTSFSWRVIDGIEAYCGYDQVICWLDTMRLLHRLFFPNVTKAHFGNNPPCNYKLQWHRLIPPSSTERKTSSSIIGEEEKKETTKNKKKEKKNGTWNLAARATASISAECGVNLPNLVAHRGCSHVESSHLHSAARRDPNKQI